MDVNRRPQPGCSLAIAWLASARPSSLQEVARCRREVDMGQSRLGWAIAWWCVLSGCEQAEAPVADVEPTSDVSGDLGPSDAAADGAGLPGDASTTDANAATDATVATDSSKPAALVYLNEIAAQGTPLGTFNPSGGDWVELFNPGDAPRDLSGWRIASPAKGFADAYPIPPGVSVPAKGFLILYFNHDNAGSPVIDDKLKGSVDAALQLWDDKGLAVDQASWLATQVIKGGSVGRQPDGSPTWKVYAKSQASPGQANK